MVINYKLLSAFFDRFKYTVANLFILAFIINISYFLYNPKKSINFINSPNNETSVLYQNHILKLKKIIAELPQKPNILAYRNLAGLVNLGLDINIEGATTFNYLWMIKKHFDSQVIYRNIIEKKYDLIFEGIQKFPQDLQVAISEKYDLRERSAINLYYNSIGEVLIYTPKENK